MVAERVSNFVRIPLGFSNFPLNRTIRDNSLVDFAELTLSRICRSQSKKIGVPARAIGNKTAVRRAHVETDYSRELFARRPSGHRF